MGVDSPQAEECVLEQEMIVHRKRTFAVITTICCLVFLLYLIAEIIWWNQVSADLSFLTSWYQPSNDHLIFLNNSLDPSFILLLLMTFLGMGWVIWHMVIRQIIRRDPAFVINGQGIQIGKLPLVFGNAVISWNEIGAIYTKEVFLRKNLCIRPKDTQQYLSRFPLWKRWTLWMNARTSIGEPIIIPQYCLKQSVESILQQLSIEYARELDEYNIQLQV
jgi:hypothetical protein